MFEAPKSDTQDYYDQKKDENDFLGYAQSPGQPGRRMRHPSMHETVPGAFPVQQRAFDERSDWTRHQQQHELPDDTTQWLDPAPEPPAAFPGDIPYSFRPEVVQPEPVRLTGQPEHFKWRPKVVITWICLLSTVCIGVGVRYGTSSSGGGDEEIEPADTITENQAKLQCQIDLEDMLERGEQPAIDLQCECLGNISYYRKTTESSYDSLRAGFIPDLIPFFASEKSSCSYQNLALVWLALDNEINDQEQSLRDRYLLALLYFAWNGTTWTTSEGWLGPEPACSWDGVSCISDTQSGDTASGLSLANHSLHGTVPSEIGLISALRSLDLSSNSLSGSIASQIGSLDELELVDFSWNRLTGDLPTHLANLDNLQHLDLESNGLSLHIPSELGLLSSLTYLSLKLNFGGSIPPELTQLTKLQWLNLESCSLVGSIPSEIGIMSNLEVLLLESNLLKDIPTEIGELSQLRLFSMSQNPDLVSLPSELGNLVNLEALVIGSSGLRGAIPEEFRSLGKLAVLDLGDNELTGTVPSGILELDSLQVLRLRMNQLSGGVSAVNATSSFVCLDIGFNEEIALLPSSDGEQCPAFELILLVTTSDCDGDADQCDCCTCANANDDVCRTEGINILTSRFYS